MDGGVGEAGGGGGLCCAAGGGSHEDLDVNRLGGGGGEGAHDASMNLVTGQEGARPANEGKGTHGGWGGVAKACDEGVIGDVIEEIDACGDEGGAPFGLERTVELEQEQSVDRG